MRTFAVGTLVIALVAAACASPVSEDVISDHVPDSPVTTSPVTTSPVTTPSAAEAPTTILTTMPPTESGVPSGDQDDGTEPVERETTVTTQPPKETSETRPPTDSVEPNPSGPVAASIADLATRLGVDASKVTLVSQEEVTWSDGSLGCPQPDMSYIQVLVNGSLIILEAGGTDYEYHSGGGRGPFYCSNPIDPVSGDYGDA